MTTGPDSTIKTNADLRVRKKYKYPRNKINQSVTAAYTYVAVTLGKERFKSSPLYWLFSDVVPTIPWLWKLPVEDLIKEKQS